MRDYIEEFEILVQDRGNLKLRSSEKLVSQTAKLNFMPIRFSAFSLDFLNPSLDQPPNVLMLALRLLL